MLIPPQSHPLLLQLSANKLELWMSLESERFLEPVFRVLQEKDVILEERRLQVDNSWSDGRDVVGYGLQGASIQASCDWL